MCVIVYKPEDHVISKEILRKCFEKNDDGCGFMYPMNGKLIVKKGYFKFDAFYNEYKASVKNESKMPVIFHFRIKTHGKIDTENCHPFNVSDDLAFAHNGVISGYTPSLNSDISDTIVFNNKVLKTLYKYMGKDFCQDENISEMLENLISKSKIAFMDSDGNVAVINESLGDWRFGCWFSNLFWNVTTSYNNGNYNNFYGNNKKSVQKSLPINSNTVKDACIACGKLLDGNEFVEGICNHCLKVCYENPFIEFDKEDVFMQRTCSYCGEPLEKEDFIFCKNCYKYHTKM